MTKIACGTSSKYLLGFSNDDCAQVFNLETKQTALCSPGHQGHQVKNGQVNGDNSLLATTGTDGCLNIYKIEDDQGQLSTTFLQKIEINKADKKVGND